MGRDEAAPEHVTEGSDAAAAFGQGSANGDLAPETVEGRPEERPDAVQSSQPGDMPTGDHPGGEAQDTLTPRPTAEEHQGTDLGASASAALQEASESARHSDGVASEDAGGASKASSRASALEGRNDKDDRSSRGVAIHQLLHAAAVGDLEGIRALLARGRIKVNQADYDGRTALHLACSEGRVDAVQLLLELGAEVNPKDRFGNTPLADAQSYGSAEICRLLKAKGGLVSELHAAVPGKRPQIQAKEDVEIDPADLEMASSTLIGKGIFGEVRKVKWKGTWVAVKLFQDSFGKDKKAEEEFLEEVRIFRQLRHPNVVLFMGAVTKTTPHMLVTEFMSKGNLHQLLKRKGTLAADEALKYALDIARGMNYLHQHKPEPIVHRDLTPHNLLRNEAGMLKVGDFGLSRIRVEARSLYVKDESGHGGTAALLQLAGTQNSYRYLAPEVFGDRDTNVFPPSVDVFSFGVILHEMFEGLQKAKFSAEEAAEKYSEDTSRPPLTSSRYPPGMKELIRECWDHDPEKRPTFEEILQRLEPMSKPAGGDQVVASKPKCCAIL